MQSYLDMLKYVKENGKWEDNRTGIRRLSTHGYLFTHYMKDGFPLLTTKKMNLKNIAVELEFFIKGLSDKKWLQDRGCHIWDEWASKYDDFDDIKNIKYAQFKKRDLGAIYGCNWRNFNGWNIPIPEIITDFDLDYKKYIDLSSNKMDIVGKTFSSNLYDNFVVIKEYYVKNNLKYDIKFLSNGYVLKNVTKQNIINGECRNHYYPSICNVGCIGYKEIIKHPLYKKLRSIWEGMLHRCYVKSDKCYNIYGQRGVYVSNRWLILSNFIKDVQELPNWKLKEKNWNNYTLDKDYMGMGFYSKYSCTWLSKKEQALYSKSTDKNFNNHLYKKGIDQFKNAIETIKKDPTNTQQVISAWNPSTVKTVALPSCHYSFQLLSDGENLDLIWNQRSCDLFLGVPYNIASYALLLMLIAKEVNLKPNKLVGFLADLHLYENHLNQVEEQLNRTPYNLPTVNILNFKSIFDWEYKDLELTNYNYHPAIKADIAV